MKINYVPEFRRPYFEYSIQILPPQASTIRLQIKRPKPIPFGFRLWTSSIVENSRNNFGIFSLGMPKPVSVTEI